MKKLIVVAIIAVLSASNTFSEEASDESVRELMNKTNAGDMGIQVMNQLLPALQQMIPDAPQKFWDEFMDKVDPNDLVDRVIPIYKKHFTEEDIIAIIEFYNSPVGKKFINAQPAIVQESMAAGQSWGREIAQQVIEEREAQKQ